jgi:hypothetical protein
MRLEIRRLDALKAANSCQDLWMHITNPEYSSFQMYVRSGTGVEIPTLPTYEFPAGGEPPEYWEAAEPVIDALEWSIDELNLVLPAEPTPDEVGKLRDKLEQEGVPGRSEIEVKVLRRMVDGLLAYVLKLHDPDDHGLDHLIRVPQID